MRVFRATYKDRRGRPCESAKWYVEFKFRDVVRRIPVSKDKAASEEFGRRVVKIANSRELTAPLDLSSLQWIETLPAKPLATLRRMGIVTAQLDPLRLRPLSEPHRKADLLSEFAETMRARNRTPKHIQLTERRVRTTFKECGLSTLSELDPARIERHLRELRDGGSSARTSNHRLASCRAFTRWAVERGLLLTDPLARLRPVNPRLDPRLVRRALGLEELRKLVQAAQDGPDVRDVSGPTRAAVWRLAAECGLRVSEIAALQVGDVDLDPAAPMLTVRAAVAKNRTESRLPLREELAQSLAPFVREKLPTASLLALPRTFRNKASSRWLCFDLKRAGLPFRDASDRVADVHSLRASFVSMLIRSGASPKVVQTLARHSDPRLTLGVYSKLRPDEERRALDGVPSIAPRASEPAPEQAELRRTGSDAADVLASCLASDAAASCSDLPPTAGPSGPHGAATAVLDRQSGTAVDSIPAASTTSTPPPPVPVARSDAG